MNKEPGKRRQGKSNFGEAEEEADADNGEREQPDAKNADSILQMGSVTTHGRHVIHCLTIIGQVEGHYILPSQNKTTKYEHVMPQLVAIEQDKEIKGLLILINTVGGDVEAGLAIAELIAGMSKPTVTIVLGGGHSIGVPLAVSANRSFIVPSATMTIHPVRMNGLVLGVPQTLSYFEKMQDRIVSFVVNNSRISEKRFRKLLMTTGELVMDVGTVLNGGDAVKEGLIDELGGLSDAVGALDRMIDEREAVEETEEAAPEAQSVPARVQMQMQVKAKGQGEREEEGMPRGSAHDRERV